MGDEMREFCVFLVGLGGGVSYAPKGVGFSAHKVLAQNTTPSGGGDFRQNSAAVRPCEQLETRNHLCIRHPTAYAHQGKTVSLVVFVD